MSTDADSLEVVAVGLRGLLELGVLVALGYWGFTTGDGLAGVVLGLGAPLAVVIIWGVAGSPAAPWQLSAFGKRALTVVLFATAAVALALAASPALGLGFGIVAGLDTILLYWYGWD